MTLKDSEYQKSGYPASLHFCKWRMCSLKVQYLSVVRRFSLKISDIFFLMFLSSRRKIRAAKWIALSDSGLNFYLFLLFCWEERPPIFAVEVSTSANRINWGFEKQNCVLEKTRKTYFIILLHLGFQLLLKFFCLVLHHIAFWTYPFFSINFICTVLQVNHCKNWTTIFNYCYLSSGYYY